ncbi:MAG: 23S rRNA (adenine(2503)-C(2))-methyltransferase RlmN [Marinilabiliaceae bacterium]|mgnify:CR=1 FL=1|nr:23S rRNA (adenine(2503)-C(2))-methyltransferase RlmN [Marinilabiliaceae bacterium]
MKKEPLFGKDIHELNEVVLDMGLPKFAAKQMAQWLYAKGVSEIDAMTNISVKARAALNERFCVGRYKPDSYRESIDGTRKYLFRTPQNRYTIETAMIPDDERRTLCVSSQVGCKMKCLFCMTGRGGFEANLTATDIINQYASIEESRDISNIVFMGMGEPLDNVDSVIKSINILTSDWGYGLSPRRITLSTIGVQSQLRRIIEDTQVHIAISIHSPFSEERQSLMPSEQAFPIANTISMLREYDWSGQRRLSFEMTLFHGLNDTNKHAEAMAKLLKGLPCRVNLIRFNSIPDTKLQGCTQKQMEQFRDRLNELHVIATIRNSKGQDIEAACGLLKATEEN